MPSRPVLSGQDLDDQVYDFRGRNNGANSRPKNVSERDASRAMQKGQSVDVQRKSTQLNKQGAGPRKPGAADDDDIPKVKQVDHNLRVRIMKARQELNWTQQDLAQRINQPVKVVAEYENGKAIPDEAVIVKMEKAFGLYLRGAKAGQQLGKTRPTPKPKD